jgi:GAF domain-containing protein
MPAPHPENEAQRLRALHQHRILDTAAERVFDDLTRLAAAICETPISLVSLVDRNRQWFKSRVGMQAEQTSRDVAFCAYAILTPETLVVEDVLADARFAGNPLVTEDPNIRFYAGAPLTTTEGHALGTLCVIDTRPRRLSAMQRQALEILRGAVQAQIELRRAREDLTSAAALLRMCAWCRSVRGDDDQWRPLHELVAQAIPTSHGICPTCSVSAGMSR